MPHQDSKVPRTCRNCGANFLAEGRDVARGGGKFCRRACLHAYQHTDRWLAEKLETGTDKFDIDGCWVWTRACYAPPLNYGKLGHCDVTLRAHRVAYELAYGPIPDDLCVLHKCDNPPCVRPDHLFLGTRLDNNEDKRLKRRHAFGETHPLAKLSEAHVREIHVLLAQGLRPAEIAIRYAVSRATIDDIRDGKKWRHVA